MVKKVAESPPVFAPPPISTGADRSVAADQTSSSIRSMGAKKNLFSRFIDWIKSLFSGFFWQPYSQKEVQAKLQEMAEEFPPNLEIALVFVRVGDVRTRQFLETRPDSHTLGPDFNHLFQKEFFDLECRIFAVFKDENGIDQYKSFGFFTDRNHADKEGRKQLKELPIKIRRWKEKPPYYKKEELLCKKILPQLMKIDARERGYAHAD